MRRREVLAMLGGATAWPIARAQSQPGNYRLAVLTSHARHQPDMDGFRDGLRDLGYIEGQNIVLDWRYAERGPNQLAELTAELIALRPDVILSVTTPATQAVKAATSTIPVVFANVGDPVASGFVASLARPGENITGVSALHADLSGKRLQLLKEVLPNASLAGVMWNPGNAAGRLQYQGAQNAAPRLGLKLLSLEVQRSEDIPRGFETAAQERADWVLATADPLIGSHRRWVVDLAARHRLPTMYVFREFAEIGGLISYGLNSREHYRSAATFVDKILKGARPTDLPVEQPTRLEMVINRKTAQELGLDVPPTLLARADEVIE